MTPLPRSRTEASILVISANRESSAVVCRCRTLTASVSAAALSRLSHQSGRAGDTRRSTRDSAPATLCDRRRRRRRHVGGETTLQRRKPRRRPWCQIPIVTENKAHTGLRTSNMCPFVSGELAGMEQATVLMYGQQLETGS